MGDSKSLYRVTFEVIDDGVVVSGRVASAHDWRLAFVRCIGSAWEHNCVIATMLLHKMDAIFDECYGEPENLFEYESDLAAIKAYLDHIKHVVNPDEMARLVEYEKQVRSGETDEDEASAE